MTPITRAHYTITIQRRAPSGMSKFFKRVSDSLSLTEMLAYLMFAFAVATFLVITRLLHG